MRKLTKLLDLSDIQKLDKHITDNFFYDHDEERELEVEKDIYWVEGYLCAIQCSCQILPMNVWLPYINGDCTFESEDHINKIMSLILGLQNNINSDLRQSTYTPLFEKYNLRNETKVQMAKRWSKGYVFGMILSTGDLFQQEQYLLAVLFPILNLAGFSQEEELKKEGVTLESLMVHISKAARLCFEFCQEFDDDILSDMQQNFKQQFKNENKKIGRNDPCHCKSGKKYKKCCLLN